MAESFDELADRLSFTEIVRLQDALSRALVRRFGQKLALVFSDIVSSTHYFTRFGDEAGRKLQQRHTDLCGAAAAAFEGRIVDTAGDGVLFCFASVDRALSAVVELFDSITHDNDLRVSEHRLRVRVGVHFGPTLTDGTQVSGDSVNFCSRVFGSTQPGEVRLSAAAFTSLTDHRLRLRCHRLGSFSLKGFESPIELLSFDWRDEARFPSIVRFEDGSSVPIPHLDVIRFGRLPDRDGIAANDVILSVADPIKLQHISRWHFELHLTSSGYLLRSVSRAPTVVDGIPVSKGEERLVRPGAKVTVGGVLTIELGHPDGDSGEGGDETYVPR